MNAEQVTSLLSVFCGICAALLVTLAEAGSRDIHYGAVSDEKLATCDELHWRGRVAEARSCYGSLLAGGAAPAIKAEAAWSVGDVQQANRWFQQAMQASPEDTTTRVRWGDLFAATHQDAEAMDIYREALATDADNGFANLGAARVLAGRFDDAANGYLDKLLNKANVPDGARIGAWLLVGKVALENGNLDEASKALQEAESLIEEHDWPPLQVYALRAARDMLENLPIDGWAEQSLAYNAHYGAVYAEPAYFYVITRRYREAIDHYQRAVDVEPGLASAHEELGVNLLRDNQMGRARSHLEIAHELDPFSPKAVNTLRLLDSFSDFKLISDPATPGASELVPLVLRLHKEEADVIAPYAIELARNSIAEFTSRYGFELREPVVIEMYPDHEDFAVRTAGMPGIGILGATFGYVVAMDSPSGRPPGEFQWGTTLWHEMAHVFTLEATNHLVPRWFSEGVSVFEEWRSGPQPGVRIPMSVYNAMKEDLFLPVAELDEGFIRPTYEEQIIVSYMQAGLICQFIDTQFGTDTLAALLYKFADGLKTADAVEAATGLSVTEFDRAFAKFVQDRHGPILDNLDDWQRTQQSITQLSAEADWQPIPELASHAIELLPHYVEADSPYIALARAERELGNHDTALAALEAFWRSGGFDPDALQQLAAWLQEAGRAEDAIEVLQRINLVEPLDQEHHGRFGDLLLAEGRAEDALLEYSVALALDPHDKATAYYRMARAYHELGNKESSQDNLLLALDVAPNYRPAQRLLLEVASGRSN